ncbi:DNA internalization-related competence protein ComEC/Rec2 [Pediococcus acidilactici]|uniref:DNA internalization-related competence protein ComEC/Rec2 n=2 Tax=Pediococcus acidilactici TaxID=1254 RepID=UPI00194F9642|nr:DNA internalization-related competence protein ComEC/Rec2 [Pediococcus acidilactici]MBM6604136.1 DNA internalization-related competence protein ComEC/Rec2 [Pediococcus acidilactici]MBM6643947.1 DNA internalization-related competence protein ComEC/Rec2 [Pediococcus acidilactici]MDB8869341.1 DNA internalization-related competence protein ComEC/Rec2 [Pediococcus acidilactici]
MESSSSLIWATVTIFLLAGYVFTRSIVFLVLLFVWFGRVCWLRQLFPVVQVVTLGLLFGWHFSHVSHFIGQHQKSYENVRIILNVHPDEVKIREDGISIRAFNNSFDHQGVQAFIPLESPKLQQSFQNNSQDLQLEVAGNLGPLAQPTNVNQFDFRRIMYGKKVYYNLNKTQLINVRQLPLKSYQAWMHHWRKKLLDRCQQFAEPLRSYCAGIILGEQTDFLKENSEKLRNLGIIHLFCISGLHVFYFIKLIEKIGILLRIDRETLFTIQMVVLPVYFVFGGGSTSLFRAVTLVLIKLVAQRLRLNFRGGVEAWCIVLLINLWLNPFVLLQMGGQLSYLLSLVLISQSTTSSLKISFKLFLVEIPIILFSMYKIHLLTVLFNLLCVPLFSSLVIPAVLIAFCFPLTASVINQVIIGVEWGLQRLDQLPGLLLIGKPSRWLVMFLLVIALKIVSTDAQILKKRLFKVYWLTWIATGVYFRLLPFGEVTFFDVGQGDSILIREPFNRSVTMVDTGGKLRFGSRQKQTSTIAKNSSINYLQSIGISKIDTLCLTHQDVDHIGEAKAVLQNLKVQQLLFPAGVEKTDNFRYQILPYLHQTRIVEVLKGAQVSRLPLQILYPERPGKGANEDSLVLEGKFGGKRILLTGDLDISGEQKLLQNPELVGKVDIFKLGHHGSKTANSPELLSAIFPKLTVVSAGRNNRYGHPNAEVIERLQRLRIPVVSTQDYGMISYRYFFNGMGRWKVGIDKKGSIVQ